MKEMRSVIIFIIVCFFIVKTMSLISICIINMSELCNVLFILEKIMYLFDMVTVHYSPRQQPNRAEEVLCPNKALTSELNRYRGHQ